MIRNRLGALTVVLLSVLLMTGCGVAFEDRTPGNPVGTWVSDKRDAIITLDESGSGSYAGCKARPYSDFSANEYPATIEVDWEKDYPKEINGSNRIMLSGQDLSEEGNGGSLSTILYWVNGHLEMGVDIVIVFKKTDGTPTCADLLRE